MTDGAEVRESSQNSGDEAVSCERSRNATPVIDDDSHLAFELSVFARKKWP